MNSFERACKGIASPECTVPKMVQVLRDTVPYLDKWHAMYPNQNCLLLLLAPTCRTREISS